MSQGSTIMQAVREVPDFAARYANLANARRHRGFHDNRNYQSHASLAGASRCWRPRSS